MNADFMPSLGKLTFHTVMGYGDVATIQVAMLRLPLRYALF